jgi:hypothetical protein
MGVFNQKLKRKSEGVKKKKKKIRVVKKKGGFCN